MQLKKDIKMSRNSICQCGSGKKYKKCCLKIEQEQIQFKIVEDRIKLEEESRIEKEKNI